MVKDENVYIDKLIRIALIVVIVAWSFQLIYPLSGVLAWGFILAVVLYPFYNWLCKHLGNRSILAATIISLGILLLVIGITLFITNDIAHSVSELTTRIRSEEHILPKPPANVQHLPVIGEQLHEAWTNASDNLESSLEKYSDTLLNTGKYALVKLIDTSKNFIIFVFSIIFSGFLLVHSSNFMKITHKFAKRVANENGIEMINMVRETIQNVSRGVIGIALLQTLIFWILLLIAGVSGTTLLSLLALILSIVQLGLFALIIPIIIWLFWAKSFGLALIITIFLILDSLLDSFLKPIVLARGLSTPMSVIFIGVIGGILMYGLIGVFIGPVVLAIAYDLFYKWISVETN